MHIHSIEVKYSRSMQPKDYENAHPSVTLAASLDEADDPQSILTGLMSMACANVFAALGKNVPTSISKKLEDGDTPTGADAVVLSAESSEDDGADEKAKAEKAAKAKAEKAAKAAESDVPDGDDSSDDVPDGDDSSDDVPDVPDDQDGDDDDDEVTAIDLQKLITQHVSGSSKLDPAAVKAIMKEYNAARISEISDEDRPKVKDAILKIVEA